MAFIETINEYVTGQSFAESTEKDEHDDERMDNPEPTFHNDAEKNEPRGAMNQDELYVFAPALIRGVATPPAFLDIINGLSAGTFWLMTLGSGRFKDNMATYNNSWIDNGSSSPRWHIRYCCYSNIRKKATSGDGEFIETMWRSVPQLAIASKVPGEDLEYGKIKAKL
ncbi:hypothetical protein CYLTODRAFT_199515 [Cylindrobasidium torrendii FP15055 ss-10]|uniref:Uncharacterized protein n=1 Tax=Cylindrobasidium torrendii FP15055 ss-10 TaxID=1314674 RepID=A0A0D7AVR0_9AGAR|nr:hypothetical protein CYLTODRAFT_199515 [Cylindrobasidium torrendii FP15055 ss-10]